MCQGHYTIPKQYEQKILIQIYITWYYYNWRHDALKFNKNAYLFKSNNEYWIILLIIKIRNFCFHQLFFFWM